MWAQGSAEELASAGDESSESSPKSCREGNADEEQPIARSANVAALGSGPVASNNNTVSHAPEASGSENLSFLP